MTTVTLEPADRIIDAILARGRDADCAHPGEPRAPHEPLVLLTAP